MGQPKSSAKPPRLPTLLFAARFWDAVHRLPPAAQERLRRLIARVRRANVVLHCTVNETPRSAVRFELLGRRSHRAVVDSQLGAIVSSSGSVGPFTHKRFHTVSDGKVLLFETNNIIRAGKSTHGDAVKGVISFARLLGGWPTAMAVPNTVASCNFTLPINEAVRDDWRAVWTTKFPGIAITFRKMGATVELFLKQSNWIAPGVRGPEHLVASTNEMCELWEAVEGGAVSAASDSCSTEKLTAASSSE